MLICDKLIQLRRERGYSQEQLANMLNVSRQAVSKWEAGNSTPELEKIIAMADIFGVSVDYLVRDNIEDTDQKKQVQDNIENVEVMKQLEEIKQCINKQHLYEYRSKKTIFGIPLVHIKLSRNGPAVAQGIVAIGNISIGILSLGGIAVGLISIGGIALGLLVAFAGLGFGGITFAGVSVGVLAFGGVSLGIYASGGVALASKIAVGGVAAGNIAIGQVVDGKHVLQIDTVSKAQIKEVILEQYPHFNKVLLKILLAAVSKSY